MFHFRLCFVCFFLLLLLVLVLSCLHLAVHLFFFYSAIRALLSLLLD